MGDSRRRTCVVCGRRDTEVGMLSWTGKCDDCGKALLMENIEGIHYRKGYAHKRRLKGMARWIEREMLDLEPPAA